MKRLMRQLWKVFKLSAFAIIMLAFIVGMIFFLNDYCKLKQLEIKNQIEETRVLETNSIAVMPCREATRALLRDKVNHARREQDKEVEYFGLQPVQTVP